jgi:hypothetical protein
MKPPRLAPWAVACMAVMPILACSGAGSTMPFGQETQISTVVGSPMSRMEQIPADAVKISPATDDHPPTLNSDEFEEPVPVPGRVNTAGAEDSPFITPDGNTLYFFFTPDVRVPVEKQVLDGVTGIYVSKRVNSQWAEPARVVLQDPGKLALDGCEFVLGDVMWFCSAREGFAGVHWFTATLRHGTWQDWQEADFDPAYQVGELHITQDGNELYFGADKPGGKGGLDIWSSKRADGAWQEPVNVAAVNTADNEGWPALNPQGDELWFSRNFAIWRSGNVGGAWQAPAEMVSSLAGEPSIDGAGNAYFVHHFYRGDVMIEADIYVAYRK